MPISQVTSLTVYGSLVELVEHLEKLHIDATEPSLWELGTLNAEKLIEQLGNIRRLGLALQQQAIEAMLGDDPSVEVNPITGRVL